jgi:hypothetical protein
MPSLEVSLDSLVASIERDGASTDTTSVRVFAAALALLFILPACGAQTSDSTNGAKPARQNEIRARLNTVVVPAWDIGGLPGGLRVTPGSGWVDNRLEARSSYDRADSAASLARAGRVIGYQLVYNDAAETALRSGRGLEAFLTSVELFSSTRAASSSLRGRVAFARRLENRSPQPGIDFGAVRPFAVKAADEAYGVREAVRFGDNKTFRTLVGFRRGRIVGTAMVVRVDREDGADLAERLVGILDSRIQIALDGGSNGDPVSIPEYATAPDRRAPEEPVRPAGAPDLAAIALGSADVPPGIKCNPGEYTDTTPPRFSFRRSFCTHGRVVGRTPLISLANEVNVFESEEAAKVSLSMTAQAAATQSARDTFAENFTSTHNVAATNVRSRRLDLGDRAVGILFSFDTKLGSVVDLYALAQAGRGVTTVEAMTSRKAFHREDIVRLLRVVQRRLATLD